MDYKEGWEYWKEPDFPKHEHDVFGGVDSDPDHCIGCCEQTKNYLLSKIREAHAAGLAEGEAKRAFLVSLIRQVSEFKDIDWDNDSILAYEAEAYQKHLLQEAEAKLYDTEVKRGQDIMEFEREKKALNAELAAAKFEAKEAREKYQGVLGMRDSLARELAKLTAERDAAEKAKEEFKNMGV